jgi:transcriptional regulator
MYNIPYYKASDSKEVLEFMCSHPFIILAGCDAANKPVATHIPVIIEIREGTVFLLGHVMKNTDHHIALQKNSNVLAIFSGPHTYISASWYTNQKQASTWNYLTVHAKGTLSFLSEESLLDILQKTTKQFENNTGSPSLVEHLDKHYIEKLMKAIVAVEIEVTEVDHVFKLSQNRDEQSYDNIVKNLREGDASSQQVAEIMQQRINKT